MDHPKCRLCGAAHPLGGPHVWDKESTAAGKDRQRSKMEPAGRKPKRGGSSSVTETSGPAGNADQGKVGEASAEVAAGPQTQSTSRAGTQVPPVDNKSKRGRPATGFDKKAYQRDLMRKRRSKK